MDALLDTRVQKINQPFFHGVVMEMYGQEGRQQWLFSAHPRFPRICRSGRQFNNPPLPPLFCLWLRTRILHAELVALEEHGPRLRQFTLKKHKTEYFLMWENNGPQSNLLLLDAQHCLLAALRNPNQKGRVLKQTLPYVPPVQWETLTLFPGIPTEAGKLDAYYWNLEQQEAVSAQQVRYRKYFKTLKKKLIRRLAKQEQDLENCQSAEKMRRWGELLKPHLHQIQCGQTEITVTDYFDDSFPQTVIPLDPGYSPSGNLVRLFQKADKLKKALPHVQERIRQTLQEQKILLEQQDELKKKETAESFQIWDKTLPGFLKIPHVATQSKSKEPTPAPTPLFRLSSDGLMIAVGRNKQQNAYVTFTVARGNDWWFHAQGISGAHVIVKNTRPALPSQTLLEAAHLAAYYCKARSLGKIEVDYTQQKYVRKIKGSEPGTVTYSQNKSILVDLNKELLQRLLANEIEIF